MQIGDFYKPIHMLIILYLKLISASLVGLGIQLVAKNKSIQNKAGLANVQYHGMVELLRNDLPSIIGTLLTISLFFLIIGGAVNPGNLDLPDKPMSFLYGWVVLSKRIIYEGVLAALFATIGYTGMDIALRFFSVTNRRINKAIDYKTTIADQTTGTIDTPTPTAK